MWQFFIFLPDMLIRSLHAQAITPVWVLNRLPKQPKTRKSPSGDLQKTSKHCLCSHTGSDSAGIGLAGGYPPGPLFHRNAISFSDKIEGQ